MQPLMREILFPFWKVHVLHHAVEWPESQAHHGVDGAEGQRAHDKYARRLSP